MKNIGIVSNNEKKETIEVAKKIYDYIAGKGNNIKLLLLEKEEISREYSLPSVSEEDFSKSNDLIITVGGDGTFLRASKYTFERGIPIMGINAGNLGFLTVVEKGDMYKAIDSLLEGKYGIEERMLIESRFYRNNIPVKDKKIPTIALNEFAITRSMIGKIIRFTIVVNGIPIKESSADGLIVSTPTGSTAYSLSAGGPIVEPKSNVIIITPICPHTLLNRSIILDPDNKIEIMINSRNEKDSVSVDGKVLTLCLKENCLLKVKKSELKLKFITFKENIFFKVFRGKFIERI